MDISNLQIYFLFTTGTLSSLNIYWKQIIDIDIDICHGRIKVPETALGIGRACSEPYNRDE